MICLKLYVTVNSYGHVKTNWEIVQAFLSSAELIKINIF